MIPAAVRAEKVASIQETKKQHATIRKPESLVLA
jgi:hypothetical protein